MTDRKCSRESGRGSSPVQLRCCSVFVVFLVAVLGGVYCQYSMKVHLSSVTSTEGGQLKVNCEVTDRLKNKSFFILWIRKSNGEEVEIGTNAHINDLFNKTGRYKAGYSLPVKDDFSKVNFFLSITNLTSSDSGEIGCRIPDNVEILRPFTVIVPVTSVRLMSYDVDNSHAVAYLDGQNVTFVEGERHKFSCYVNGSYPQPEVKVTVGRHDVTHLFDVTPRLVSDGPKGLQVAYYRVDLVNQGLEMEYKFSREVMKCTAVDRDHVLPAKSAFIYIHLSGYRPKFDCSHQYIAKLYDSSVNVTCSVTSDPPLIDARVRWWRLTGEQSVTLRAGERDGHYGAVLLDGASEFQKVIVFSINKAYPQTFRLYTFEAENKLGTSVHGISLTESGPHQSLRSGLSLASLHHFLSVLALVSSSLSSASFVV